MTKDELSQQIFNRYGIVTRAKGYFLYTKKGVRLTDMYQENGRAILGWSGGAAFTQFKNYLTKGLTGSFRTEEVFRIKKAVSKLLNSSREVFIFSEKKSAIAAALTFSPANASAWKPFSKAEVDYSKMDALYFSAPFPWAEPVYLLAVKPELCNPELVKALSTIKLPFALEAGITRSIYDLIEAISVRQEKDFFIHDPVLTKYWERSGCYLMPKLPQEKYDEFVLYCLDNHVIINPEYDASIVPFDVDRGNFTLIKNSPFKF